MFRTLMLSFLAIELIANTSHAQQPGEPRLDRFGDPLPVGALARLGTLQFHHCTRAAYSPNGKIIATYDGHNITLWDVETSRRIRELTPDLENRWIVSVVFSPDGKKLAAVGDTGARLQYWNLDTFNSVKLEQKWGNVTGGDWSNAAAFSSDSKTLYAGSTTTIYAWDVASGKKLKELPLLDLNQPVPGVVIAFSPDGMLAATWGENMHLWDTQTGKLLHKIDVPSVREIMRFSPDNKSLVIAGERNSVIVYSVETGKKVQSLYVPERVASVAFSPDGKTLAAAINGTTFREQIHVVQIWDFTNLKTPPVKYPAPGISAVLFSPNGKTLAWTSHGQTLCFMDRATGKDLHPAASHRGAIKALVYHPDGKRIISAGEEGTIRIWDANTGESLHVLRGHVGEIHGLALFPNGKLLASGGEDNRVRLWDIDLAKNVFVSKTEGNAVTATAYSADGTLLASTGRSGVVSLRDPATGKLLDQIDSTYALGLAISPDGKTLAVAGDHGPLMLHNLSTTKVKEIPAAMGGTSVAYSPNGKLLAVGAHGTTWLLDAATHAVLRKLPGHHNRRGCVAFSPDSRYLASVSDGYGGEHDRTIRIFEMASGSEILPFKKDLPIFAAAFSPDGSKLVVGGDDATAVVLDLHNLTGKKRADRLSETELSARWEILSRLDAAGAYEAKVDLLHAPNSSVLFLGKQLKPAPAIDAKHIQELIKSLDSDVFKERDQATKELEQLGELVQETMRKALAGNPPPEAHQRLQTLLSNLDQFTPTQLRNIRDVEILETIGTPEALKIIDQLAKGNPDGLITSQSKAVVARVQKKKSPLPEIPKAQSSVADSQLPSSPVLPDLQGDPMPPGAIARLGSARWRLMSDPLRILVSPNGKMVAVVNGPGSLEILDAQSGKKIERIGSWLPGLELDLSGGVALSADWRKVGLVEIAESKGVLAVFDRGKSEKVKIGYSRKKESHPVPTVVDEGGFSASSTMEYLSATEFSPDGRTLVGSVRFVWSHFSSKKSEVKESHLIAWDSATGKELWRILASAEVINSIAFSPDGKTLTVVDSAGIGFRDAGTGKEMPPLALQRSTVFRALFTGPQMAGNGRQESNPALGSNHWQGCHKLPLDGDQIRAIAFTPDGKLLAGGGEKTMRFWDPVAGKHLADCSEFKNFVLALGFSSDGKTLFSGHVSENVLRRWDVATRKPIGEITGATAPAQMLLFSPDSSKILSSSKGNNLCLWETRTGKPCPLPNKAQSNSKANGLLLSAKTVCCGVKIVFPWALSGSSSARMIPMSGVKGFLDRRPMAGTSLSNRIMATFVYRF